MYAFPAFCVLFLRKTAKNEWVKSLSSHERSGFQTRTENAYERKHTYNNPSNTQPAAQNCAAGCAIGIQGTKGTHQLSWWFFIILRLRLVPPKAGRA